MRPLFRSAAIFILVIAGFLMFLQPLEAKKTKTPGAKQFASVDGAVITETQVRMEGAEDLDSLELQMLHEKAVYARNEHRILEQALERLVEDRLLKAEAARRGIAKEELVAREVQQKVQEPTPEEIDAFYEENKQRIKKPKEEVAAKIGEYLKIQEENNIKTAFLKGLEKEHPVIRSLEPLRFDVNADGRPSQGPSSAPVVLVVFSDFQCPYCRSFDGTLKEIMKKYNGKVRLVYRQFPLTSIHPNAQQAAEASLCAADQNHFWEMHDLIFRSQNSLREEDLKNRASKLGLDMKAFNSCLASKRHGALIHEDVRAGTSAGVDGTPTLFVNGRYLNGVRSFEDVAAVIDEELQNRK